MADEITQVTGEGNATPQNAEAAAEPRTFTQEEVNAIVERRVARVKATPPADYEDLRAKAARASGCGGALYAWGIGQD